jgi:hypothetical protein
MAGAAGILPAVQPGIGCPAGIVAGALVDRVDRERRRDRHVDARLERGCAPRRLGATCRRASDRVRSHRDSGDARPVPARMCTPDSHLQGSWCGQRAAAERRHRRGAGTVRCVPQRRARPDRRGDPWSRGARIKGHEAPGARFRNFHASIQLRGLRTRRVAFPAYAIAYRYRSRLYRTVISGQDPACVIGQTPISVLKVALLVALILAGFAVAMVGLILGSM